MKSRSLFFALCTSIVACGGAVNGTQGATIASADATKAYPIHLHRPSHVGERMHVVIDASDDNTTIMHLASNGKEVSNEHKTHRSHLEGIMTTTAIDARQDELRSTLDVTTLTYGDVVLLQNTRIDITKAPKADDAILMVGGAPASPELRKVLKDLLSLRVGGATDDEIFGTAQPQLVGGHWPINGERATADLADDQGPNFASTKISGETTFRGLKRVGDIDALEMTAEMLIDGITFPLGQPGATCEPGRAKGTMSKVVPVDENRGALEQHTALDVVVRIHVPTPNGDDVVGDITVKDQHDGQMTPL